MNVSGGSSAMAAVAAARPAVQHPVTQARDADGDNDGTVAVKPPPANASPNATVVRYA
ncbi:MAG: hypothetical protein KGL48_08920 [Sphingomonadales bacterium]|nr:hypothetical protein [Sphingomonadales bacterium]MDE2568163.1 hypothetical protein [Sphingomonadales bacterium]